MRAGSKACFLAFSFCCSVQLVFAQGGPSPSRSSAARVAESDTSADRQALRRILQSRLPRQYMIADIQVNGAEFFDPNLVLSLSHLSIGQRITLPRGDEISKAIARLWKQQIFEDVRVYILRVEDKSVFLRIDVVEKPRLSRIIYKGVRKSEMDDLDPKFSSYRSKIVTSQMRRNIRETIRKFYVEKGFLNVQIYQRTYPDQTIANSVVIVAEVVKGSKNKIEEISFFNHPHVGTYALRSAMAETKVLPRLRLFSDEKKFFFGQNVVPSASEFVSTFSFLSPTKTLKFLDPYFRWNIFSGAKFSQDKYRDDKEKIIELYNSIGYRDAKIRRDTVYLNDNKRLQIEIDISEGHKFYFGNMSFQGNTKYPDSILREVLDIHKGEVYNMELLYTKLGKRQTPGGGSQDLSSLYLDDGYLFFRAEPVETRIYNDTIDHEIRVIEGPQATIKNVNIFGNEKTKDFVIRRELRTYPGDKFSRTALIRSQRELANLKFFNPEKIGITPVPNLEDGTVDINYTVEEKSADQVELAAGYSGVIGLTGTVGITFNNFAIKDVFNARAWRPVPGGDGEQLSLRFQSNGPFYTSLNAGFVEPWIGKKKRISLSVNTSYTFFAGGLSSLQQGALFPNSFGRSAVGSNLKVFSAGIALAKQVKWPDDYFTISLGLNLVQYSLRNYALFRGIDNGKSTNMNLRLTLSRVSIDQALFPHVGSNIVFTAQYTPPYSFFLSDPLAAASFRLAEYQKYKLFMDWYVPLTRPLGVDKTHQLILKLSAKYGYILPYNRAVPLSPFERFQLGDQGLLNQNSFFGFDIIAQPGYFIYDNSDPKINPQRQGIGTNNSFFSLFNKYVAELRYPVTVNPGATIFASVYFTAANGWYGLKDYNPLELRRSVGVGVRFFLPALGMLGFDYAVGIDRINPQVSFKDAARFHFILGFEPD